MQDSKDQDVRGLPLHFFGGLVMWVLQLVVSYALAPVVCENDNAIFLILLTVVAAIGVCLALFLSFRTMRKSGGAVNPASLVMHSQEGVSTKTFIGMSSIILNIFFLTLIIFTGISTVLVNPCPYITMQLP